MAAGYQPIVTNVLTRNQQVLLVPIASVQLPAKTKTVLCLNFLLLMKEGNIYAFLVEYHT